MQKKPIIFHTAPGRITMISKGSDSTSVTDLSLQSKMGARILPDLLIIHKAMLHISSEVTQNLPNHETNSTRKFVYKSHKL